MSKGAQKPPRVGSSLTDAVVAALGKIDEEKTVETGQEPAAAEAGCAATRQGSAPPPLVEGPPAVRTNGFRNGPGSFADLIQRWAGGPGIAAAAPPEPAPAPEPAKVEAPAEPEAEPVAEKPPEKPPVEATAVKAVGEPPKEDEAAPPPGDTLPDEAKVEAKKEPAPEQPPAPGGAVDVHYFGRTDVGLVREHNEDNFLVAEITSGTRNPEDPREVRIDERGCIFAVCDGMGGAAAGEVASQMAVDTILEVMSQEPAPTDRDDFARRLVHSIEEAGHRIFRAAKMDRPRRGTGTTTTLAGLVDDTLFVGQVGDSRAYVLRGDDLVLVTKDQSLVNQLIEAGQLTEEEAEAFEHSNIILQALGTTEEVTVDLTFLQLRRGDRLMMCSDGLSGLVHADMIKEVLQETKDLTEASAKLIQMANAGGGHDNITVIVADFDGEGLTAGGESKPSYQQYPLPPADDTVRGKSLPPRDMRMKAPATKPGADVKRDDYAAATPLDGAEPSGGGGKMAIVLVVLLLLGVAAALGWYFYGGGAAMLAGTEATDEAPPPPPPVPPGETPDDPVIEPPVAEPSEPGEALGADVPEPGEAGPTGRVEVATDLDEGTLYVNGEARGEVEDGMTLDLAPGAYSLEVRLGDTTLAGPVTVTVAAEGTATATLDGEVVEPPAEEPPVQEVAPTPVRPTPAPAADPAPAGATGGTAPARRRSAGSTGPIPSNPF